MGRRKLGFTFAVVIFIGGCVQRTLVITSDPSGAVIFMNDQEIGRTPMRRDFTWYGTYDVQVRKEGYETLYQKTKVIAPWWQWIPFDFLAEFWPGHLKDIHYLSYTLAPSSTQPANPAEMFSKADELKARLESSQYTHPPTTTPATKPTTHPTTRRAHPTSLHSD
ncbi:MAG TPA: PEGA domain-containing protein [Tepidisphaeraceae bacterium]|nr:PEGA domain-containing protein [Tepidisphaeraceae bacterium]